MERFLKTAAIYLLAGPPLAALATVMLALVLALPTTADFKSGGMEMVAGSMMLGLISLPLSYVFGGLQALFVGVGCAVWWSL